MPLLYLLRTPADAISSSLYSPSEQGAASVVSCEDVVAGHVETGQSLTYKELLDVVMAHDKIITL
jgi:hypothetical protein